MAAVQAFTPLADIKPFKTHWKIQVKIVHSWTQYTQFTGETVEMVLADTAGTLIHATVKKPQVSKLQRFIVSGEWRIIEHFTLTKSTGKYRATKHGFKMSMMEKTVISRTPAVSDDIYVDLANFPDILNEAGLSENILIGTISILLSIMYLDSLPPDVIPLTIEDSKTKQVNAEQRKKDYYDRFPRKTISGLFCFSETGKCNIICTIMNIDTDYSWYFFSCLKCSKTAYKIPKVENEIVKKGKKEMFWCPTYSDQQTDQRNDLSIDQEGLALTNSGETTDPLDPTSSTPSSKRSMDAVSEDIEGQGSTTKKACVSSLLGDIEKEEIEGGKN
ncbi:predicted protein [Arabidopsis lyrata subsp. lyrata]|uniref:Predicted protein n=1 Tax=Arabidopsis lyrata subsp. lyrata TaxID=81972 RepID=D7LMQ4_ARALL|nr:predicted protein [Arabidopsis lyrata subsp. lyrata]